MTTTDVLPTPYNSDDLLLEWFRWWCVTDEAPGKMPDALHVRTAMQLLAKGKIDEEMLAGIVEGGSDGG